MMQLPPHSRIFVATEPVDCRKGLDGLAAVCRQRLGDNPLAGAVYVFRPRSGTSLTLLLDDGQGYWLCRKRLSKGRCAWWPQSADARVPLSARELIILTWNGHPDRAQLAQDWRRVASGEARLEAEAHGNHAAGSANTSRRCSWSAPRYAPALTPAEMHGAIRLVSTLAMEALCGLG